MPTRALKWTGVASSACALMCSVQVAQADDQLPDHSPDTARPRTCLVLDGGGARGAAHVGLLKVLERERVPVDCIVGTSMGAIVGGLYASGYKADEIESIIAHIDWNDVLHDRTPRYERSMRRKQDDLRRLGGIELGLKQGRIALPRGIIQGQRLELLLRRLLLPTWKAQHFDDLPIPFRAIAADIVTGDKVVFDRGELAMAIRASMSVPGAFAPIRVDGRLLVDGGIVDNVPIDEARKLGAERLIVSRVGSPLFDEEHLDSPLAISEQTSRVLMKRIVEAQVASLGSRDLLIAPALGSLGAQEFNRAMEASAIGLAAAEAQEADIKRFSASDDEYREFQARHVLPAQDPPLIAFVELLGQGTNTGEFVKRHLADVGGKPLDVAALEQDLAQVYGENRYEQLQWRLKNEDGVASLQVEPLDKHWGPTLLHTSLRLSSDFDGISEYQLGSELTLGGLTPTAGELRLQLGLGRKDRLRGEWYQPWGRGMEHASTAHVGYEAFDLPLTLVSGHEQAQFRYHQWAAGVGWRYAPSTRWELRTDAVLAREGTRLLVGDEAWWRSSRANTASVVRHARQCIVPSPRRTTGYRSSTLLPWIGLGHQCVGDACGMGWHGQQGRSLFAGRYLAVQCLGWWSDGTVHASISWRAWLPVRIPGRRPLRIADRLGQGHLLPAPRPCRQSDEHAAVCGRKPGGGRRLASPAGRQQGERDRRGERFPRRRDGPGADDVWLRPRGARC